MKNGGPDRPTEGGGTRRHPAAPERPAWSSARVPRRVTALKRFLPIAAMILLGTAVVSAGLLFWRIHDAADEMGRVAHDMVVSHEKAHATELAESATRIASLAPSPELAARMVEVLDETGADEDIALFAADGRQVGGGPLTEEVARARIDEGPLAGGHVIVSRARSGGLDGGALAAAVEQERGELLDVLLVAAALALIASVVVTLLAGRIVGAAFRRVQLDLGIDVSELAATTSLSAIFWF